VNCIHNGQFYQAGAPTPYASEADLPAALRAFVATGGEPSTQPVERNVYDLPLSIRRQVREHERAAAEKAWAEEQASAPLRPDIAEALQDAHDRSIGLAKAQAQLNQDVVDAAYAAAEAAAEPPQLYVRRGGEWARVERAKLKAGETCFVRRPSGEMEAVGVVDSRGEPPLPEIQL
jgi:hypothetical protein